MEGHTHAIRKKHRAQPKRNNALWVAEQLGIKLHIIDVIDEYKDVLLNPKHGYGQHLNPCLDCKIFMVNKALAWSFMEENGFDFIITGEVIGQRPKSQRKETMPIIARESGAEDRLLRPLCAQNLEPTLPEREGWVDRAALHGFHGRNREPQIALAEQFGFSDWAQPAGGCCFLTDEQYSRKLVDLWQARGSREYELDDIMLLKIGRHIRPAAHFKMIIGREEGENRDLEGYRKQFVSLHPTSHGGPLALLDGKIGPDDVQLAARILARYSQGRAADTVTVQVSLPDLAAAETGEQVAISDGAAPTAKSLQVRPLAAHEIDPSWHV